MAAASIAPPAFPLPPSRLGSGRGNGGSPAAASPSASVSPDLLGTPPAKMACSASSSSRGASPASRVSERWQGNSSNACSCPVARLGPVPSLVMSSQHGPLKVTGFAQPGTLYRSQSGPDMRPARFRSDTRAPSPGINAPASFHEARYTANVSRMKNRGFGAPFAIEGPQLSTPDMPRIAHAPHPQDLVTFASQAPLPPVGRPGHAPLPTRVVDAKDSYHFARAVQGHAKMLNAGMGNPLAYSG
eukprot:TRINITY_DN15219_c0_g1_i2.p1 TRINITY_DN15219_c0_g1~~TRINITY_DN15219_c0_g1_i2.p1  ORF type:complete len:255 (+),score=19.06 TRINITY_DN15219_c0_g1_i2:34-765(+)